VSSPLEQLHRKARWQLTKLKVHGQITAHSTFRGVQSAHAAATSEIGQLVETFLANAINTPNTTIYDKAIDSVYLEHGTGGSRLHHLVDGQHDLFGAFAAAREACGNDNLTQEVLGTAAHLAKDLFSKMGLPVFSIDADDYRAGSSWVQENLGISKEWQADLMQINGMELFCGMLSATCLVFGVKQKDAALLVEMAASTGLSSVLAANPISMAAACIALVMAWQKRGNMRSGAAVERAAIGAGGAGAAILTGTALGGFAALGSVPMVISLVLTLVVGIAARQLIAKHVRTFRNPKLAWMLWSSHIRRIVPSFHFAY
jgi:hypothetical protein